MQNGVSILGMPSRQPQTLTRPPQPRRPHPVTPPSILGPAFQGTTFSNQTTNTAPAPAPRSSPANIIRQNRPIQITSVSGATGTYQNNSMSITHIIPLKFKWLEKCLYNTDLTLPFTFPGSNLQRVTVNSKNNTIQATPTGGITLQSGQVLNMNQFQPLLFDANSGLLLMPTTQGRRWSIRIILCSGYILVFVRLNLKSKLRPKRVGLTKQIRT